jgi:anti-sigma-K factor RskA
MMTCEQLADVAPELALGVLTGRERADAYAHLDRCASCRALVSSLSGVTDELLRDFAPSVEPPPGFEARVLEAMRPATVTPITRHRWSRRLTMLSVAAAACIAILIGVIVAVGGTSKPAIAEAQMRTDSGTVVGWIHVEGRDTSNVTMNLPGWAAEINVWGHEGDTYSLQLTEKNGTNHLTPVALDTAANWHGTLEVDPDTITTAAMVDGEGHVLCSATLHST